MMVTPVENQLDDVYSAVSVSAITRKGDPNHHHIVDTGCVLDTGAALTITPTDDNRVINDSIEFISNDFDNPSTHRVVTMSL